MQNNTCSWRVAVAVPSIVLLAFIGETESAIVFTDETRVPVKVSYNKP
jgi:hypothetical protein